MLLTSGKTHESNEGAMVMKDGSIMSRRSLRDSRLRISDSPHERRLSVLAGKRSGDKGLSVAGDGDPSPLQARFLPNAEHEVVARPVQA